MSLNLSENEIKCLKEVEFWRLSKEVNKKLEVFLYDIQHEYEAILNDSSNQNIQFLSSSHRKVSKGNNYKGLPYLVLDYPAIFDRKNIFTIRTMIWWGKFISLHLILKGKPLNDLKSAIKSKKSFLSDKNFYFCIDKTPWNHDFSPDKHIQYEVLTDEIFDKQSENFIKTGKYCDVIGFEDWQDFCTTNFKNLIYTLK
ncbi:hypothetical protein OO013_00430 [Mangrovivirga sp. M17]|uniref:Uncharacterized protein n=1 Tax=Mangrovivirga halotolerans TaxID=2993936 RepID=A0ABT3RKG7_9BACT|nr:hypothetical protein [Mangrovivirga halotolerans]MCX2742304.1 hypothetical protein [Mangrovivirga halotolerans]